MIGRVVWTFGLLAAGAALTHWLEPRLAPAGAEPGPSAPIRLRSKRVPTGRDTWMYGAGPTVALLGIVWAAVVLPFGPSLIGADVNIGLFYFIVVVDFAVLGLAVGGWGADTPAAVEACYRIIAQLVAYVIPLGLAIIGPIMMARSLSTVAIVEAQADAGLWYLVAQPLGFALYVTTGL
ncbi:MAG: NADH-quinone oxidoreductase subunit H, partial [Bradymonadaceae bacterium]